MDHKAPVASLGLHRETRIDLEPSLPNSLIRIQLPSNGSFTRHPRLLRKVVSSLPVCKKEEEFRKVHVANYSSVYFRKSNRYPRSFLWRCLEENNTLELRSVDLSKSETENREATLVLRIGFPSPIRRGGIALADGTNQDVLNVFVLTKGNDIYTLALLPDFFCRPEASENDVGRWCHVFKPASFSISTPHRLIACSALELLVSLSDGRLMRLSRKAGEDGAKWQESAYNDGQWGSSLRGLIRWQGTTTVRYDGLVLDQNTALEAHSSPDHKHLLAVCLNHTLKAWNITTGKPTFTRDLLDKERELTEISRVMLDPSLSRLMYIFEVDPIKQGDRYYIATFSPQQSGMFKFWAVRDADFADTGIRDLFPDSLLKIPDPDDGALWTIADFQIKANRVSNDMDIWILLRLNRRYKLYSKIVNLEKLAEDWERDWTITVTESVWRDHSPEPSSRLSDFDPKDSTEKWLEIMLSPGRVPESVLETALSIYNQARDSPGITSDKISLKERIASCVGSHIGFNSATEDFTKFREQMNSEWSHFWSLVCDLDQVRWEPLSLGYDETAEMAWLVFSDGCSAVRYCGELERLAYNKSVDLQNSQAKLLEASIEADEQELSTQLPELAVLVASAAKFRSSFSENLQFLCMSTLKRELWQDCLYSVPARMQSFYDRCNFAEEVSDKQYDNLMAALKVIGGFNGITTGFILSLLRMFLRPMSTDVSGLQSTKFGLKVLVKGAQETITLHTQIITDILLLVVFADVEVDREVYPMDDLDGPLIYMKLLDLLRQYQVMQWLVINTRQDPRDGEESRKPLSNTLAPKGSPITVNKRVTTILENLFAVDTRPQSYSNSSQAYTITGNIEDLLKWVTGGNNSSIITPDRALVNIQCDFLKNGNIDLATSFLQFQPSTAWATYIRARLCLTCCELTEAAILFKKAAYNLSRPNPHFDYTLASSYFLSPLSASFLSTGLPNYYTHILSLFEPLRAHSHIIHFAQLALQQNPSIDQRSDLLARLFHASLSLPDYPTAYSALTRYTDRALQKNALRRLVVEMAATGSVPEMLEFPFPGLKQDVDAILVEHAKHELDETLVSDTVVPFYKILYAWRLRQGDLRGAAAVLVERLEGRQQHAQRKRIGMGGQKEGEAVLEEYLVAINALALVGEDEGWVLIGGKGLEGAKRKVVKLEDVRKGYQEELDRRSVLENGRFGIVGEEMDLS